MFHLVWTFLHSCLICNLSTSPYFWILIWQTVVVSDVGPNEEFADDVRIGETYTKTLYGTNRKFLYVHQTPWQKRLLSLYGKEITLLDATYRTTRYSLPLYFLCVPTNVNYVTVATFVTETEDTSSLIEALNVIKEWNPDWSPKYFMCDYAEEEINALEAVFPSPGILSNLEYFFFIIPPL